MNLYGSICLSDIDERCIYRGTDGREYLRIYVSKLQQVSQYGETHTVFSLVPHQPGEKALKNYIGRMKPQDMSRFQQTTIQQQYVAQQAPVPQQPQPMLNQYAPQGGAQPQATPYQQPAAAPQESGSYGQAQKRTWRKG